MNLKNTGDVKKERTDASLFTYEPPQLIALETVDIEGGSQFFPEGTDGAGILEES